MCCLSHCHILRLHSSCNYLFLNWLSPDKLYTIWLTTHILYGQQNALLKLLRLSLVPLALPISRLAGPMVWTDCPDKPGTARRTPHTKFEYSKVVDSAHFKPLLGLADKAQLLSMHCREDIIHCLHCLQDSQRECGAFCLQPQRQCFQDYHQQ